jgi:hypothetical protein
MPLSRGKGPILELDYLSTALVLVLVLIFVIVFFFDYV